MIHAIEPKLDAPEISIIIPAYNEEKGIVAVLTELCNEPSLKESEIIVVDDGSSDETIQKVRLFPRVRLIRHLINKGYGASISSGVKAATGTYILWFDADGQHRVEDLVNVAQTLISKDLDYCIGIREAGSYQDSNRKLGKFILKGTVRLVAGKPINDFN